MTAMIGIKEFQKISEKLLIKIGAHKTVASDCTQVMLSASLRGIDTHGIEMLPKILTRVQDNRCRVDVPSKVKKADIAFSAVSIIDAKLAPGQHSCLVASREAIKRANQYGIGFITVRNSTHFGCCSPFLEEILKERMVGFVGSNNVCSMAAFGLEQPNIGNNPFGFAAPSQGNNDFIFDFSSAVMSYGRRIDYLASGKELAEGSFITVKDNKGIKGVCEVDDSQEQVALPFGGFKGASVAMMIDILSGLLSGGYSGVETETLNEEGLFLGPSHFVLVIDPKKLGLGYFEEEMQNYIEGIRKGDDVRLPGDNSDEKRLRRLSTGIPIQESFHQKIEMWAQELKVELNW